MNEKKNDKCPDQNLQQQVPGINSLTNFNNVSNVNLKNQIEQLINYGVKNGDAENSNSITDSDKKNIEYEMQRLGAQFPS